MIRPGKGFPGGLLPAATVLVLTLAAPACSGSSPGPATFESTAAPSSPLSTQGPTAPTPESTRAAVRAWILHWARSFVTLGQEVVVFRQAERDGLLARMARLAAPIEGAARQVAAGISLAPDPPRFLVPQVREALRTLVRVRRGVRSVVAECRPPAGSRCRNAGSALYDLTDPLLSVFARIFREGGFPIPTPS